MLSLTLAGCGADHLFKRKTASHSPEVSCPGCKESPDDDPALQLGGQAVSLGIPAVAAFMVPVYDRRSEVGPLVLGCSIDDLPPDPGPGAVSYPVPAPISRGDESHNWRRAQLSTGPLQALGAYIELSGTCPPDLVEWNKRYGTSAMAGETARGVYYLALGSMEWGGCGKPYFSVVFKELQKAWGIFAQGLVSEAEFEAKESELINLLFAALGDQANGGQVIRAYETSTAARLMELAMPRQYFNCTFFGDHPRCMY